MAFLSLLKHGVSNAAKNGQLVRLTPLAITKQQQAGLVTKKHRGPRHVKPFPYTTHKLGYWEVLTDRTLSRLYENSRIIVVEGNICSGKSTLAKKIADEFGFLHFQEAEESMFLEDPNGFDLRSIEHHMPEPCRPMDWAKFYANPTHKMLPHFLHKMLSVRAEQYFDAMAHVLNTGEGAVLERSSFSDFVFFEAMFKFGYVTKMDLDVYNQMRTNVLSFQLPPHAIVYLDVPAEVCHQRIKARGVPHEQSPVLSVDYLREMERVYKDIYLQDMLNLCEVLPYDWTDFGKDVDVIEDLEQCDLEDNINDSYGSKHRAWREKFQHLTELDEIRLNCTTRKRRIIHGEIEQVPNFNTMLFALGSELYGKYTEVVKKYSPKPYDNSSPAEYMFDTWISPRIWRNHNYRTRLDDWRAPPEQRTLRKA